MVHRRHRRNPHHHRLGAAPTGWTPQIEMDAIGGLWWDSADVATGAVSSWLSREGLAHAMVQATGSAQPTKGATGVVWDGGDRLSRTQADNTGVHVRSTVVPDGTATTAGKGFTCTGLARVPSTNQFWISNHGQAESDDVVWAPSLVRISYDTATGTITKLQEIELDVLYPGIESVQGVAYDTSDNTLWFADATGVKIRHITTAGVDIPGDAITPTWTPNGLAYVPADDAVWIGRETSGGSQLEKRSCVDGTVLVAAITTGLANIDQLFYHVDTKTLLLSYGANGSAGTVAVYNAAGAGLVTSGTITLPDEVDAVEGIVWEGTKLYVTNDSFFHPGANPLNLFIECNILPPMANVVSISCTIRISATTGTDCLVEMGAPLGGHGFGIYPTSATAANAIANTGASGTTEQGTATGVGFPSMVTDRLLDIVYDVPNDLVSIFVDGTAQETGSLANLVGPLTLAKEMDFGSNAEPRPMTGTIKDVMIVAGLGDRQKREGYRAHRWGLTANLPSDHPYKTAAPLP